MKCRYILRKTKEVSEFLKKAFEGPVGTESQGFKYDGGQITRQGQGARGYFTFNNTEIIFEEEVSNPLIRIFINGERGNIFRAESELANMFPGGRLAGGVLAHK